MHDLVNEKFDGKQRLLAEKLNKSEAELSKWFNGLESFTTRTLIKLPHAFEAPIIAVCTNGVDGTSEEVKISFRQTQQY